MEKMSAGGRRKRKKRVYSRQYPPEKTKVKDRVFFFSDLLTSAANPLGRTIPLHAIIPKKTLALSFSHSPNFHRTLPTILPPLIQTSQIFLHSILNKLSSVLLSSPNDSQSTSLNSTIFPSSSSFIRFQLF